MCSQEYVAGFLIPIKPLVHPDGLEQALIFGPSRGCQHALSVMYSVLLTVHGLDYTRCDQDKPPIVVSHLDQLF